MDTSREGYPFRFRCRRSGNCCAVPGGIVRVGEEDIERIATFLGITPADVRRRYVKADGRTLRDDSAGRCIFLTDGRQAACSIYEVRPAKCASWPYWPELLLNEENLAQAYRLCPGLEPR